MAAKIPATVVTGFLGAGKTTLIRHLLSHAEGERIALIVNEFGDLGVDGELVRAACDPEDCADEDVIELANGCICCAVADDFLPALEKLLARKPRPTHIVVETSGLALPQPLVRAFAWPEVKTRVTVDGVVTVVDGAALAEGRFAADEAAVARQREADDNLDHATELAELFEDQIACADLIVVNKADVIGGDAADELAATLSAKARPGVQVVSCRRGGVAPAVLLGLGIGAEDDLAAREEVHHHHHDDGDEDHDPDPGRDHGHDAFESFVAELPEIEDPLALEEKVEAAIRAHDVLRVKGFATVSGKPMRLALQAVGPRVESYFDRPLTPGDRRGTRLVVIGKAGLDRAAISTALGG